MILVTNDDGMGAAGIMELERVCLGMGLECVVVAPVREMSECSHCVTTKGKLVVERMGERRFAVGGTAGGLCAGGVAACVAGDGGGDGDAGGAGEDFGLFGDQCGRESGGGCVYLGDGGGGGGRRRFLGCGRWRFRSIGKRR